MLLEANRKLNPSCTANCEFGATFRSGQSGVWAPFVDSKPDGGVLVGESTDVAIGSTVRAFLTDGDVLCEDSHEVGPAGFEVTAIRFADAGNLDCRFRYR